MNEAATGSLQNLHDVVAPPGVGWWPLAPGWYFLFGLCLLGLVLLIYRQARQFHQNRYRRAALQQLEVIRQDSPRQSTGQELAVLLKQTALAAWPRAEVASLSGEQWARFLVRTGAPDAAAEHLSRAGYLGQTEPEDLERLHAEASSWIRNHRRDAA